ncbi:hypothetical protein TNCV_1700161 [Trichonephila clavipes]|nr:hypothetical protein TNCV_1700161 [Trichonephila clavipes]
MNSARYIGILTRSMKRLRRVRSQYAQQGSWFFVHDNAHPHTSNVVKPSLPEKVVGQNEHPLFLPDHNLPDYFLLSRFKLALKGKIFDDISDIQQNGTRILNSITKDSLQSFLHMRSRSQRCIVTVTISKDRKVAFVFISSTIRILDYSPNFIVRGCIYMRVCV